MPLLAQPLITLLLLIGSVLIQLGAQLSLDRLIERLPKPRGGRYTANHRALFAVTAILVLLTGHLLQVGLWGVRYYVWGELGGLFNSFYFSLASFTTVGANELELSRMHRFTGAVESAMGMLMFGWSTALLVEIIQRTDSRRSSR
jgi:hypothetical protein